MLFSGYVIEFRDPRGRDWAQCGKTTDMSYTVTSLTEGTGYLMRVAAENEVGRGPYTDLSSPATPKSQFSEFYDGSWYLMDLYKVL